MPDQLFELNNLRKYDSGVWVNPDDDSDFYYSDGTNEEQYLADTLNAANDLSLDSVEVRAAIHDWVSEYHLSSQRSNLIKDINFPVKAKILEIGCGCGAITRYLGEKDYFVHAIEGSSVRAKIARLRTRDLNNVDIVQHNFSSLALTDLGYDVVLFIGVLEYAKRFIGDQNLSAEQSVQSLLNKACRALKPDGLIVVAIENRTGLKYKKGACEDHLAEPFVGIKDYQGYEQTGIKTFDQAQWGEILFKCNLAYKLFYPFPDYKLPELLINDQVDEKFLSYLTSQIKSTDPISDWVMPEREDILWSQAISQARLQDLSNSYGLLIARQPEFLENRFNHNWSLFDLPHLKPECRLCVNNKKINISNSNNMIECYINNIDEVMSSLNNDWLESLFKKPRLETFVREALGLYQLILSYWPSKNLVDIDQLFLSSKNQRLIIAKYWQMKHIISPQQQFFHALLEFCLSNKKVLSRDVSFSYLSINEIIRLCFDGCGLDYEHMTLALCEQQQRYRQQTWLAPVCVSDDLHTLISCHDQFKYNYINSQLFWAADSSQFNQNDSQPVRYKQTGCLQKLLFKNIPAEISELRFDPCDHEYGNDHLLYIQAINVFTCDGRFLCALKFMDKTLDILLVNDLDLIESDKPIHKVNGIDPQFIFKLPADFKNQNDGYNVEIKIQWLGV